MNAETVFYLFKACACIAFVPFVPADDARTLLIVAALSAFFAAPLFALLHCLARK